METIKNPQSNSHIILLVAATLALNATIGMCTLAFCLVTQKELNVALFTAFVAIVNYIFGVISGMLLKTSATPTNETAKVEMTNTPENPASVREV